MATKKKTKKKAAQAVVPRGPKTQRWLVLLEVATEGDPGLWAWAELLDQPEWAEVTMTYPLKT